MKMLGLPRSLPASPRNQHPQAQVSAWAGGTESPTQGPRDLQVEERREA